MALSRIQKKAARVEKTETDREFDTALGALKRTRDDARAKANDAYRQSLDDAKAALTTARREAEQTYEDDRGKLLKRLAATEAKAA